jgi:hypothetical protein
MVSDLPLLLSFVAHFFLLFILYSSLIISPFLARVPSTFLTAQLELGLFSNDYVVSSSSSSKPKKSKISETLFTSIIGKIDDLSTKCILDIRYKSIQASAVATAIVFYVRKLFHLSPSWNDSLTNLTFHDPRTSKSTFKALQMIIEMEKKPNGPVISLIRSEGENKENLQLCASPYRSKMTQQALGGDNDDSEFDISDDQTDDDAEEAELDEEEDEEESDLVRALQKALGMNDNTTPVKEATINENQFITPVVLDKKSSFEDYSPVAVDEIID